MESLPDVPIVTVERCVFLLVLVIVLWVFGFSGAAVVLGMVLGWLSVRFLKKHGLMAEKPKQSQPKPSDPGPM